MATRFQYFDSVDEDRIYSSADFSRHLESVSNDGYVYDFENELEVTPVSPANMVVEVQLGKAWVQGRMFEVYSDLESLQVAAAEADTNRIDRVVIKLDLDNRVINLYIKEGVPAQDPAPPALQRDAIIWELSLAQIFVAEATTSITAEDITDERDNDVVCGVSEHPSIHSIEIIPDVVIAKVERETNTDQSGIIEFENELLDTDGMWTAIEPTRLIAQRDGLYNVSLQVEASGQVYLEEWTATVEFEIQSNTAFEAKNSQTFSNPSDTSLRTVNFDNHLSDVFYLNEGDYIEANWDYTGFRWRDGDEPEISRAIFQMSLVVESSM